MQYRNSRQEATGLIVNDKLNVPHEYYKLARARCHNLFREGYAYNNVNGDPVPLSDDTLEGMMSFIYQIRRSSTKDFWKEQSGFSALYKKLLDYRSFWGMGKPRIICEGKTDNIYLRSAILSLSAKFPELYPPPTVKSRDRLNVCFFNHTKRTELFQTGSGGNELAKLVGAYRTRTNSFKSGQPLHPVILVADNDSGSKSLFEQLTRILGTSVGGEHRFYHVFENLYVIPIPKKGGHTAIEDLFTDELLKREIDGRAFDRKGKEKDKTKWYGKNEFATKIVRAERPTIDFSGFEPLLKAFVDVVADYSARRAAAAEAEAEAAKKAA